MQHFPKTDDELAVFIWAHRPQKYIHDNIQFLLRHDAKYLVAILDYGLQAKVIGDKMLFRICDIEIDDLISAIKELKEEEKNEFTL